MIATLCKNVNRSPNNRTNELLSAALAYADRGLYVVPLHTPLFDATGKVCGCTCEAWKRSKKYFESLRKHGKEKLFKPDFVCRTPGKHPRLNDWEAKASKDPAQIRDWWHKWPEANIGIAAGKSGLITFDRDTYKEIYGDDSELFTQTDKDTPTQISQNGGEHLVFAMPPGKRYSNATGNLPPGIDIRGYGGMFVVEPSIGPSGKQWTWEDGFSIIERDPKPLPETLATILDAAQDIGAKAPAKLATFTAVTTEKPNLLRWRVSKKVRELIEAPGAVGQRSENDMKVCVSLTYAGATPDDILAVFQHNPIGTQGRYAESGDQYLARTIGKAQAFVAAHPRIDIGATVDNLLLWNRTSSFAPYIKPEFLASDGTYRTDATDTKTADAILCELKARQSLTIHMGKKRLAKLAGLGSCNTALNSLKRLDGWLFDVTAEENELGKVQRYKVALASASRFQQIDPLLVGAIVYIRDQSSKNDSQPPEINEYSPRKADEPFLFGVSKVMRDRIQDIAQALDIEPTQAKEDYTFAGLGESGLRVVDAMLRGGAMSAQELADETGKKLSSIRTALRKLAQHGIVEGEREGPRGPKVYSLAPDVWGKVSELAPSLRTYGLKSRRENDRLEAAQKWAKDGIDEAEAANNQEQSQKLQGRFAKLAKERLPHLQRLHPDLSMKEIERLAYEVDGYKRGPSKEVRAHRRAQRLEHAETVRMIRELAESYMDIDTPQEEIYNHIMQFGTFDGDLVKSVLQSPKQMQNYETLADIRKRLAHTDLMAAMHQPRQSQARGIACY